LDGATIDQLIDTLKHPTMLWRKHAQRLLVERADLSAVDRLIELTADRSVDEIGLNVGAIHALWTLHGLGQLDGSNPRATAAVVAALKHPSPGVRRNALQVLPRTSKSTAVLIASGAVNDDDAQVRLAAMLALADLPASDDAGEAILNAVARDDLDRWLQDACVSAAANNAHGFLTALASSPEKPSERTLETMKIVASHYGRTGPVDSFGSVVAGLTDADPTIADAIMTGLASGWPVDKKPQLNDQLESDMKELMEVLPASSGGLLVKLARSWGSKQFERYAREVSQSLLSRIDDDKLSLEARTQAARELVQFRSRDKDVVAELLDRLTPQTEPPLATGIVRAISASESPAAGQELIECFANLTPQTRAAGVSVLLSRPELTRSLLSGIDEGDILLSELSLDQKQALMAHPSEQIRQQARRLLGRGGALPNADRQAVLQSMMATTTKKGDVESGKVIFKKNCSNCHVHGGEGQQVGPDLTGMAVHPKAELLTHILDPSRDVEGNYRVYSVLTIDGVVINGLLASESKTAIEMYDAEGKKKSILREDIDQLRASAKSLMPEGFEKQIPASDMADLLEFLTARGQFVPVDMAKVATIASDRGMFIDQQADVERLIFPDWQPKTFNKVTFNLTDPKGGRVPNAVLLHSPNSEITRQMPRSVTVPCNGPVRAIHMLSGVSGWGFPYANDKTVSMIVRIHYADGSTEDHELRNGEHFADYIRRVDVPQSEFAFALRGQQIRYLAVYPERNEMIKEIELVKGNDRTAPVVMAMTLESPESSGH
jgi:hypothetical protein